jgi:predicted GNAT family acetyltransferase
MRRQARAQLMQAQAIRVAVWGEARDFEQYQQRLTGGAQSDGQAELDEAMAAFGLLRTE